MLRVSAKTLPALLYERGVPWNPRNHPKSATEHVVCFGFNVTSETSPYIETLQAYLKTGTTQITGDEKEFDNSKVESLLKAEKEKFLRYFEATSTSTDLAYVVTSINKTICNESGPSTLVYTDGVPMLLNFPGTPQSTKVTIDSITLQWTAPKHVQVSSYKVLYRSKGGSCYMIKNCRGLNLSRYIEGLSHGDEYEFKVQATSTSGFTYCRFHLRLKIAWATAHVLYCNFIQW